MITVKYLLWAAAIAAWVIICVLGNIEEDREDKRVGKRMAELVAEGRSDEAMLLFRVRTGIWK